MDPSNRPTTTELPRAQRSRITNGSLHDRSVNGRSASARRYRDIVAGICGELGKDFAALPVTDRARVHMLAGLIVQAEQQAAAMAAGRPVSSDEQVRVAGAADRLMDSLGLSPAALAARRAAEEQRALEQEARRLGVRFDPP